MNISRFLLSALLVGVLPVAAQTDPQPTKGLPYPIVSSEEVVRLANLKTIQLHLRDVTLKDALEQLAKQTGINIETRYSPAGELSKKLSLDIETESFETATDAIFEEAGVKASLQDFGVGRSLGIQWGENMQRGQDAPVSGTKLFPIKLISLSTSQSRTMRMAKPPALSQYSNLHATLLPIVDVRLPILSTGTEFSRVEDDQGRLLPLMADPPFFSDSFNSARMLGLGTPASDARSINHLEGKFTYILIAKRETWELPDVLNAKDAGHDFQAGAVKVHLSVLSARKTDDGIELNISVKELTPTKGIFDGQRHPLMQFKQLATSMRVVDANGQVLMNGGFSGGGGGSELNGRVRYSVPQPFPPNPDPVVPPTTFKEPLKLIINSPSELVQIQVPFSFENVPLP
ncbi:hypothetical protein EON83_03630 [bacterium]|nr:MAG: hypothetical protein EON83_03630 [bacterium]